MHRGYIKIWRKIQDWEWWEDHLLFWFFIRLIMMANWEDKQWRGIIIKRGQFVSSIENLRFQHGVGKKKKRLSTMEVRTLLTRLKSTNEITSESTSQFTLYTIGKYDDYQDFDAKITSEITSDLTNQQQTNNKPTTTTKEVKRIKEYNIGQHPYLENTVFRNTFEHYLEMRKGIKKPATPYAQELILKKLGEESVELASAMLEQSIVNSWQGVFPLKNNGTAEENNRGR